MSHQAPNPLLKTALELRAAGSLFLRDVAQGVLLFSHNTLALVGLAVLAVAFVFGSQADLRMRRSLPPWAGCTRGMKPALRLKATCCRSPPSRTPSPAPRC